MENLLDDNPKERFVSPVKAGIIAGFVIAALYLVWQLFSATYYLREQFSLLKALDADTLAFSATIVIPVIIAMVYISIVGDKESLYGNMLVSGIISSEFGYISFWVLEIVYGYRNYGFGDYLFDILLGHLYIVAVAFTAFLFWLFVGPLKLYQDFKKDQKLKDFKNNPHG